jgi:hypothetical protein
MTCPLGYSFEYGFLCHKSCEESNDQGSSLELQPKNSLTQDPSLFRSAVRQTPPQLDGRCANQDPLGQPKTFSQDCLIVNIFLIFWIVGCGHRRRERSTLAAMKLWAGQYPSSRRSPLLDPEKRASIDS